MDYKFAIHSQCCVAHLVARTNASGEIMLHCENCDKEVSGIHLNSKEEIPMASSCCNAGYEVYYYEDGSYKLACSCCEGTIDGVLVEGPDLTGQVCSECGGIHEITFDVVLENAKQDLIDCVKEGEKFLHRVVGIKDGEFQDVNLIQFSPNNKEDVFLAVGVELAEQGCDGAVLVLDSEISERVKEEKKDTRDALSVIMFDFHDLTKTQATSIWYEKKGSFVSFLTDEDTGSFDTWGGMIPDQIMTGYMMKSVVDMKHRGGEHREVVDTFLKSHFKGLNDKLLEGLPHLKMRLEEEDG